MLIPSPVPSMFRFRSSSIRSKRWNNLERSSSLIPIPVSFTCTSKSTASSDTFSKSTDNVTLPSLVYFTALVRIFKMTCLMRISSPYSIQGTSSFTSTTNSRSLSDALVEIIFTKSLMVEDKSYCTGIISIFPASSLEESRISFTSPSSDLPAV